jgi:UDPglucose 6-dehydrogenase
MKISVIGLGKLGKPILETFSERYETVGIDLGDSFKDLGEISFIVVPTPSDKSGRFTSKYVEDVLKKIKHKHTVAIVSTLYPGETDRLSKKYPHLTLAYNPTFVALGSVKHDFTHPDILLIGCHDYVVIEKLMAIYTPILFGKVTICQMKPLEAEITKLSLNCYITTKITFANQIGNICEKVGADYNKVLYAVGSDNRVGTKYFKSGLGYGGPCFPRDNIALSKFFEDNKRSPALFKTVDALNTAQILEIISRILKKRPQVVGFSGLSYKEGTDVDERSQLKAIYNILKRSGIKVKIGKGDINLDWSGICKI